MSALGPDQDNFDGAAPREASGRVSFGAIATIFLIIGPPIFGLLFWLTVSLANVNSDPLHEKITEAVGVALSLLGLVASYAVGLIPSLIAASAYSGSRRRIARFGYRVLVAALIGAAVYWLLFALFLPGLYGRDAHDWGLFTVYAAGAGAASIFMCALIIEICI